MGGLLAGKVAVITGGASGIGRGTVEAFIREGAKVVVGDLQSEAGLSLKDSFGDKVHFRQTDVCQEDQIADLVGEAVREFGRLDIMFNNAGATGSPAAILDFDTRSFLDTQNLLLASVVAGHKHAARQFMAQGSGGSIITTSSIAGIQGGFSPVAYSAAKAGILGLIRQATMELGPHGIRSNAILPGIIITPIIASSFGVPPESAEAFGQAVSDRLGVEVPLGRPGKPADIAGAALFFASDLSAFVSGTALTVDGGMTCVTQSNTVQTILDAAADFAAS